MIFSGETCGSDLDSVHDETDRVTSAIVELAKRLNDEALKRLAEESGEHDVPEGGEKDDGKSNGKGNGKDRSATLDFSVMHGGC